MADDTYVFTLQVYVTVVANGGTAGMHNIKYKAIHSLYLQLEALILHQNLNLKLTLQQEIPGHVTQYLLLVMTTLNLMKPFVLQVMTKDPSSFNPGTMNKMTITIKDGKNNYNISCNHLLSACQLLLVIARIVL